MLACLRGLTACDEELKTCYPGDFLACTCVGGAGGYAACGPAGDYTTSSCVCDGRTPGVDAASVVDATDGAEADADAGTCKGDGGPKAKYLEPCQLAEDCESCICGQFAGGARCTVRCTTAAECPAPADACTNFNLCRPPS